MQGLGVHDAEISDIEAPFAVGFDRPDTTSGSSPIKRCRPADAAAYRRIQKIHAPAVKRDTIYKVAGPMRRFTKMLLRRIIGIGQGAICPTAIDIMLAPDDRMRHMDVLLLCEVSQVIGGQEPAHDA